MAKRVTIVDVAKAAGVSISTVSTALNGRAGVSAATRAHIVRISEEAGFVPSLRGKSLSSQRAFSVGLVIQRSTDVLEADPFFVGFIGGVESVLEREDYALVLQVATSLDLARERYRKLALGRRVDGVFLTDVQATDDARAALLQEFGLPAVAVNVPAGLSPFPTVVQDHAAGLGDLIGRLVRLGHRRIAHVTGSPGLIHSHQREQAWRRGLSEAGLPAGPLVRGDFSTESGARAADQLAASADRPTAVMCANDLMAVGFLSRAAELGWRVPGEVSVTGFDGIVLGEHLSPRLTTVATSPHTLGSAAAELLLGAIAGEPRRDVTINPASVVWRESAGPVG